MDESALEESIATYKSQLEQVEAALAVTSPADQDDLQKLKEDLQQLVQLTEESLLSLKKSKLLAIIESNHGNQSDTEPSASGHDPVVPPEDDMDAEYAAFQETTNIPVPTPASAANQIKHPSPPQDEYEGSKWEEEEEEEEIIDDLDDISGTKCRAPHSHDWGENRYHSAMVVCAEPLDAESEPMVRVLFTHPTHRSMLPCQYFLDGNCRFSEQECRYSHGHVVSVTSLKEYVEPDYSKLKLESKCLARQHDGLWYTGIVVDVLEGHKFKVMFDKDNDTETVSIEAIWPAENGHSSPPSDSEGEENEEEEASRVTLTSESEDEEDALPVYLWRPGQTTERLGDWEKHTKGFGSRLMAKMGYITGQGLGRSGEGRAEPVPIQLLPQGKSLDKIMELKERAGDQNLYDVIKKQKRRQKKIDGKAAAEYKKEKSKDRHLVFDFINRKLGKKKKGNLHDLVKVPGSAKAKKSQISEAELDKKTDRHVNIQIMKTHEEMKNVQKEIARIQDCIRRNDGRDRGIVSKYNQKLSSMQAYLQQLRGSEASLQRNQKKRSDHKKLTIF